MRYFDRKSAGRMRRQRNKAARMKAVAFTILILGAGAGAVWGFLQLQERGIFNVRQVVVSGHQMADGAEIGRLADRLVGKPLWKADYSGTAGKLLKSHPAIRRVSFRVWPWGRVNLKIHERNPVAVVHQGEGLLIDGEGIIFRPDSGRSWAGGGKIPRLKTGGCSQAGIWRALRLVESAPWLESDWLFDPSRENDIRLWLPGGVAVHFGNGDFRRQWQKLGEVLASLEKENRMVCQIDLRPRGQAVAREPSASGQPGAER